MTVKQLIDMLKGADQDAPVYSYDADSEQIQEITGMIYDEDMVELQTDSLDDDKDTTRS
jgi:hypothetical protein